MKYKMLLSLILSILLLNSPVQASQEKLYSAKKYPYNLLLSKTDSVKIIYTKNKEGIDCKVEINWQNEVMTTQQTRVSKLEFNKEPLATCLPRKKAKIILAKTFE